MARLVPVIPALDAAARLPATIAALDEGVRSRLIGPWVLADGGSRDATREIAQRAGFTIASGATGRGAQLVAGAEAAARLADPEDWLLFLHADTRLSPGWSSELARVMEMNAGRDYAFHFRFALDDPSGAAKRLERFVDWRCRAFALPYGDQGLVLPLAFYRRLGGFKPWPLFEDVDLVRRIGRRRLKPLRSKAITSAERFRREGYLKRSAKNLVLLSRYYLGADPARLARAYSK
ncbi:glycosyl transferase family 2 [Marinicauda salina]|uniref:Glycosyl transferase family 2 n=1 Tax=Marinicauda salina TaxID=2135793 RepID=A0A2U2BUC2_9PROT|nr:glycosyltransferase [Marinicauda salina]PWE17631.1 glycosyl transferase family 2 [Marinicauda salina]